MFVFVVDSIISQGEGVLTIVLGCEQNFLARLKVT